MTDTARGRLLSAATATIFVPLPRRVGPTARPPFWRSRRLHPRTPPLASAALVHANVELATSKPLQACHYGPTAGIYGGKSGTADTSPATRAIVPRYPESKARHSVRRVSRATDDRDYRHASRASAPALQQPTGHRSVPSVLPFGVCGNHRASPESHDFAPHLFMRLVLGLTKCMNL